MKKEDDFDGDNLIESNSLSKEKDKAFLKRVKREGNRIEVLLCRNDSQDKEKITVVLIDAKLIERVEIKQLPD